MLFAPSLFATLRRAVNRRLGSKSPATRRAAKRLPRFESLETRAMMTVATGDFNGDGFDDMVIGAPTDTVTAGQTNAGRIQVVYGSVNGLNGARTRFWSKLSDGITGNPTINDRFGSSLATGDFNGDGFDDLAIGVPGHTVGGKVGAGAVYILYGSRGGLTATGHRVFHLDSPGILGVAAANDQFGSALAAGDFNDDGLDDLAIGAPMANPGGINNAGTVTVLYGRLRGLQSTNNQLWHQDVTNIRGVAQANDLFGSALAVGDFNADGYADLAIGTPGDNVAGVNNAGGVNVLFGSINRLTATRNQLWTVATTGVNGDTNVNAEFGFALAAGDFNDDSFDDLAIGAPGENVGSVNSAGAVHVLYGRTGGLSATNNQLWNEETSGITNSPAMGDRFGAALAVGRFNSDRRDDLAIGIPNKNVGSNAALQEGMVRILYGGASNLVSAGTQLLHQALNPIPGDAEADDFFGAALASGDFDGNRRDELAVFVPGEPGGGAFDGGVNIFQGTNNGLNTSSRMQLWERGTNNVYFSLEERNRRLGEAFLRQNRTEPGVITTSSGLQYKIVKNGQGDRPDGNDNVRVNYRGTLIDGTEFDAGMNSQFNLGGVIEGFSEALQLMREGDEWIIYVPSELAYGEAGQGANIGPNAVLIFELELLEVLA